MVPTAVNKCCIERQNCTFCYPWGRIEVSPLWAVLGLQCSTMRTERKQLVPISDRKSSVLSAKNNYPDVEDGWEDAWLLYI